MLNDPWVVKYAPKTIDEMVLDSDIKDKIKHWIKTKDFPSMTLAGTPGIGKSTLANILLKELDIEKYIVQSCSIDGSIEMVKTRVNDFCQMVSDTYKVVVLDEADCLTNNTSNAGAQMALRNIISESLNDTRFILTCNYSEKLIDALKSRCPVIQLKFSTKDVLIHILDILKKESISYTQESLQAFVKNVIKPKFPDIRSIISHLEIMSSSGTLTSGTIDHSDYAEILQFIHESKDIMQIREYLLNNEDLFSGDYIKLAGELFNFYNGNPKEMMIIAEGIYKMSIVLDKEIQFTAMIASLKGLA